MIDIDCIGNMALSPAKEEATRVKMFLFAYVSGCYWFDLLIPVLFVVISVDRLVWAVGWAVERLLPLVHPLPYIRCVGWCSPVSTCIPSAVPPHGLDSSMLVVRFLVAAIGCWLSKMVRSCA